jgi:hypothetical protein
VGQPAVFALDPRNLAKLRPADARVLNFDQNLPSLERLGQSDLVYHQRLPLLDEDGCLGVGDG